MSQHVATWGGCGGVEAHGGAFHGALWELPILLEWIYVAWLIILFGAEVCRVHQEEVETRLTLRRDAQRTADTARVE